MISKEQILQAEGDDLSRMAGEVLQPEIRHHDMVRTLTKKYSECNKCKCDYPSSHGKCKYSDPIPLTPANAFKWRDWAVEKYGESKFVQVLYDMLRNEFGYGFLEIIAHAQPKHYIKAAMLCKEQSNE